MYKSEIFILTQRITTAIPKGILADNHPNTEIINAKICVPRIDMTNIGDGKFSQKNPDNLVENIIKCGALDICKYIIVCNCSEKKKKYYLRLIRNLKEFLSIKI